MAVKVQMAALCTVEAVLRANIVRNAESKSCACVYCGHEVTIESGYLAERIVKNGVSHIHMAVWSSSCRVLRSRKRSRTNLNVRSCDVASLAAALTKWRALRNHAPSDRSCVDKDATTNLVD
ncbi:PREDICTED: uncharacterized protein LOC106744696 [Dinoponera quadriceps]|uniref:Uncharacterized protein LOC106744696 n=1 Tax=Dinoponera quadriceps TaxID=609295 RepID=A0A6P3X9S4_DINQU|nr:PREDICTED: uncharacterized protein LOC106744696 [Dinoponera quadriceps]